MATVYVQFSDASESKVIASFSCPQDLSDYPHQGVVAEDDSRYLEFQRPSDVALALVALDKTDVVALRCFKAGIAFPQEWRDYVTDLRNIIRAGGGNLPAVPAYPEGT